MDQAVRLPRECSLDDGRPKIRYDTRLAAKTAARRHLLGEHAYRCRHCGYFHLARTKVSPTPATAAAMPIVEAHHLERGTAVVAVSHDGGKVLVEGRGLLRGVAYRSYEWGVERGYVLTTFAAGRRATLLDAVNGRVVSVAADDCTEVDNRYRYGAIGSIR